MPTHLGGCLPRATPSHRKKDWAILQLIKDQNKGKWAVRRFLNSPALSLLREWVLLSSGTEMQPIQHFSRTEFKREPSSCLAKLISLLLANYNFPNSFFLSVFRKWVLRANLGGRNFGPNSFSLRQRFTSVSSGKTSFTPVGQNIAKA